jgi:hypothetical protein
MSTFVTLDELKAFIGPGISLDGQDLMLQMIIDGVESLWDEKTGRVWATGNYTEYHDVSEGCKVITLRNFPVILITHIYNDPDWVFGSDTEIDDADYKLKEGTPIVYFQEELESGNQSIKIEYSAGYGALTLPQAIKLVMIQQMNYTFKKEKDFANYNKGEAILKAFQDMIDFYKVN